MHGAGNDFVLLDLMTPSTVQDQTVDEQWSRLARRLCDRHFGIGSDGLLLVLPSERADARMRMFNPDGSESASCGNGIRCLGRYVHERYGLGDPDLRVETGAGMTTIIVHDDGTVTVDMGKPILIPAQIPVQAEGDHALDLQLDVEGSSLRVSCVSMGNPHAISFLGAGELGGYPLGVIGPRVETHSRFPLRTNFEICEVVDAHRLRVRVWERGAGITLACGTGACATVVAAVTAGRVTSPVVVELPGGELSIEWVPGATVRMTGPAEYAFTGSIPADFLRESAASSAAVPTLATAVAR
jgi:diaminopimelate epimerase